METVGPLVGVAEVLADEVPVVGETDVLDVVASVPLVVDDIVVLVELTVVVSVTEN